MEEQKTVLGWFLDTRPLLVQLPTNKFIAWTNLINMVIQHGKTTAKEVESIIGCLGHLGMAIPFAHHFLSRLRNLQARAKSRRSTTINDKCHKDLKLMINNIKIAHDNISMNLIVYRRPTHVYCSDSCPAGLGRYSDSGFAWQYYLEPAHQFWVTNNLLEHIAAIIIPWVNIIWGHLHSGECALSMTDSTTLEGWLRKTNFSKLLNDDPIQATVRLEVARLHSMHYINLGIREYSQCFPGKANVVANLLSHDDDRTDTELTTLFCIHCPSQIPEHFKIQPLPSKITSWLTALLLRLPVKVQLRKKHTRTRLGHGNDGPHTAAALDSPTHSLTTSHASQESNYLERLPWLCGKLGFQDHLMSDWLTAQSKVPFHMYVRPSASTANPTHPWMTTASLDSFYNGN